ncbi:hypothetical protein G6F46_015087 [Rhizopus delemar]|nr:hypothetical protein G6F46_015087 [Rhizopus delemar]
MPGQADPVRHVVQVLGQLVQDLLRVRLQRGAAEVEHRPVLLVHDLDAQAFRVPSSAARAAACRAAAGPPAAAPPPSGSGRDRCCCRGKRRWHRRA